MKITITAATGQLGEFVTREAIKTFGKEKLRLAVRNPEKAEKYTEQGIEVVEADYMKPETLNRAFKDTELLIYIPSISHPSIVRVPESENVIGAAEEMKVGHFIFASFFCDQEDSPFHMSPFFGYTTRRLACSKLKYTVLKNAMYADPLIPYLPELQEMGKLIYPVPHGKISFISREESAKAIVKVASDPYFYGKTYILTQDRNYTMYELAEILTGAGNKKIEFKPVSVEEFGKMYDEPEGFGAILASLYEAAEKNLLGMVTDDYREIMGYKADDLETVIKKRIE